VLLSLESRAQSVLSTGQWFKFSVELEGVYKITAGQLREAGMEIGKVNPRNLKLYGGCFGMLPQPNSAPRINALQEIAITVAGEEDGVLNDSDYLLFYGQNPDRFGYNPASKFYEYENNFYTDLNFYFVTAGTGLGKRIPTAPSMEGTFPTVSRYSDFIYYENDKNNIMSSGREWFGEAYSANNGLICTYTLPGIVPNTELKFVSRVIATYPASDCFFDVAFNNHVIKTQTLREVSNKDHRPIGSIALDSVALKSSDVAAPSEQTIKYVFKPGEGSGGAARGYLDFFSFTYVRALAQYYSQTFFTCPESTQQPVSTFAINNVNNRSEVWDVTDPFNAVRQTLILSGSKGSFSTATSALKHFAVFSSRENFDDKERTAKFVKQVANQDLASLSGIQYLIITHDNFLTQAQRLAAHRASYNHVKTAVVTVEQIYNEYSGGKQDVTALRDFIRAKYSDGRLENVLLFGKGTYDYRNIQKGNNNFVPIYESRESLWDLASYASDDYLGMVAENQGEWAEDDKVHDMVAVGLGRIPVKTAAEAQATVDKLIEYDAGDNRFGAWRSSFLFIADDGDDASQGPLHMWQSDQLASKIETKGKEFIVKRLFLDDFAQPRTRGGQTSRDAYNAFGQAMDNGYAIMNYTGHGAEQQLAAENILDDTWIKSRSNGPRYPLFITATCSFGCNDKPGTISGGEKLILLKGAGAIGLISSVRSVLASSNYELNKAFYEALFELSPDGKYRNMGALFKDAKNKGTEKVDGRNYIYLGDPGLTLPFPNRKITISNLTSTAAGSKDANNIQALIPITVKGQVTDKGAPLPDYTGKLRYIVLDRPIAHTTKGDDNVPFTYQAYSNRLAEGTVTVRNGQFQFNMLLSKNYSSAPAALSKNYSSVPAARRPDSLRLYFYSNNKLIDYSGFSLQPPVKEISPQAPADNTPPTISLYINDSTFVSGGTIGTGGKFIALLNDEHGIDLSNLNPDTKLRMVFDGAGYDLYDNYYATDDNDYKKGRIDYLMSNLSPGRHTITLYAADTYGNKATASIVFNASAELTASEFYAFPNPASDKIQFTFIRNQIGEDMDGVIEIFSTFGQRIKELSFSVATNEYRIVSSEWDMTVNGTKIAAGFYVARLTLRFSSGTAGTQQSTRLAIYY